MSSLSGIKCIEDFELKGKNLFLRLDLNVPMKNGVIMDDTRILAALPTINFAIDRGAKIVLASHLGRPKTLEDRKKLSLEPVATRLNELLNKEIILIENPKSDAPRALLANLDAKQIILLENLRFEPGETKNESDFAESISRYTDIYINDAFGASHRAHASIVGVPKLVKKCGIGFLVKKEIEMLDKILFGKERPFVAILGGSKISDKIDVIRNLIDKVDAFIIGGAMAYTFLAARGRKIGQSLVERDKINFAKDLMLKLETLNKSLWLPEDHVVVPNIDSPGKIEVTSSDEVPEGKMAVDIGPKTRQHFAEVLRQAKTVFWNGPMGVFETKEYSEGTFYIARELADSNAFSIVGGGDSASAAKAAGVADKMDHISTGGGASLEYLQGIDLPGIKVLRGK